MSVQGRPLYAVIDLGSNSFHMLIARLVADNVQVVDKVKRKVRLASGLDETLNLDKASMARGWECLSFFAERLQDIPAENIRVIATATLRIAQNAETFLARAEEILQHKVSVITGEQEAKNIYLGVAHTNCNAQRRLVVDIGGASTEIVLGDGFDVSQVCSLNMGCVTYNQRFFRDEQYDEQQFTLAIAAAEQQLSSIRSEYCANGWDVALGGSGIVQTVLEILSIQKQRPFIKLDDLYQIKRQVIDCGSLAQLDILGLQNDRKPTLASGLAILIAIFKALSVESLQLAGGALREGVLYELLPNMRNVNIRQRTIQGLISKFHIDTDHARRVTELATAAFNQLESCWQNQDTDALSLLKSACAIHEIGLLFEFKRNKQHAAYILQHADLPGFTQVERQLLIALVGNYKEIEIDNQLLHNQMMVSSETARLLLMVLRLAIILCKRRQDDVLPSFNITPDADEMLLTLPENWLKQHPLIAEELNAEAVYLATIGIELKVKG